MNQAEHQDPFGGGRRADRHRNKRLGRLLLAFLSALVPGVGQIVAGVRTRGLVMLAVVVVLLASGIALAWRGVDWVLSYLVQPSILLLLLGLNAVLLFFRLFAVLDAYRLRGAKAEIEN
ncbi:MAG: hypothetical protein H5T84_05685, partial [Thermoleophilia bacterium]|nr:hypothetical protein [Thermoleophilia bacterium]